MSKDKEGLEVNQKRGPIYPWRLLDYLQRVGEGNSAVKNGKYLEKSIWIGKRENRDE